MIQTITFDTLPENVTVDGIVYPVNYGYRAMMAVEIEMFSEKNDEQKLLNALNLFYFQNIPPNADEAIKNLLWFHRCGEDVKKGTGSGRAKTVRGYCFKQDAPLIYAAFRQQYQVDLRKTTNKELHWWEFSAMFGALDDNVKMSKVIYWRTCDLNRLPKEQKRFVAKMRSLYALKMPESNMDSRTMLAKRNADMKAYVRKRMEECRRK